MSSASFASSPPSEHEELISSQFYPSADENALYEESRRLAKELDTRIANLASGTTMIIDDVKKKSGKGKVIFIFNFAKHLSVYVI